jgi:hypothetical protein
LINQLKKDETIQLMNLHGDTVNKIRNLMDESGITPDQLQILLVQKQPKEKNITRGYRKNKKKSDANIDNGTSNEVVQ